MSNHKQMIEDATEYLINAGAANDEHRWMLSNELTNIYLSGFSSAREQFFNEISKVREDEQV